MLDARPAAWTSTRGCWCRREVARGAARCVPCSRMEARRSITVQGRFFPPFKPAYPHRATPARRSRAEVRSRGYLTVRLAALLHDIGKPRNPVPAGRVGRSAFHLPRLSREMTRLRRDRAALAPTTLVRDVSRLVELHLGSHGYGEGDSTASRGVRGGRPPREPAWTDAAVRRSPRRTGRCSPGCTC